MLALLTLLPVLVLASNRLQRRCDPVVESQPWIISNIQLFNGSASVPNCVSWVCFHYCDYNSDWALDTECPAYVNGTFVPGDTWYFCENHKVRFQVQPESIVIERWLNDTCYDGGVVMSGNGTTSWFTTPVQDGEFLTIESINIPALQED